MQTTIHLIANAHIDNAWLWDAREGMNEGISTCRAMVDMLDEFPDYRFIRGEASIYEYIERHDPALFLKIQKLVAAGRWELVGGNYIQPDNNLTGTEPLLRQFIRGRRYFQEKFGRDVTAAWAADSFGHSAGLPEILAAAGMRSFACTRPPQTAFPLPKPAFWWEAASGARILSYRPEAGWYGTDRDEIEMRLELAMAESKKHSLQNVACFYGMGNHGGGPSRRQLHIIDEWRAGHPELRVIHSGLHDFFEALRKEECSAVNGPFPIIKGELNFCLRGCSASMARFKYTYRKTEAQFARAERAMALASAADGNAAVRTAALAQPWDDLLFSAFHDILPGTVIESGYGDQFAQIGRAFFAARCAEAEALLDLAKTFDTLSPVPPAGDDAPALVPVFAWNPHPKEVKTHVEMEVPLDFRLLKPWQNRHSEVPVVLYDETGRPVRFQSIPTEHRSLQDFPWRWRAVVPMTLPALGVKMYYMGLGKRKQEKPLKSPVGANGETSITNGLLQIEAESGSKEVRFRHRGVEWLPGGLQVRLFEDEWGSWGGMFEERDSWLLSKERERWSVQQTKVLESGPERAALWVRFAGQRSRIDLTFLLCRGEPFMTMRARVFLDERSARLKLVFPGGGRAEYQVPGGTVMRAPCGEVHGGRWVRVGTGRNALGFASDALYGFDTTESEFRATVARATRYATDERRDADEMPWVPAMDIGELCFSFLLTPAPTQLPDMAAALELPPLLMPVPARKKESRNNAAALTGVTLPPGLRLLTLQCVKQGCFDMRAQNETTRDLDVSGTWFGREITLGSIKPNEIATWRVTGGGRKTWRARRISAV